MVKRAMKSTAPNGKRGLVKDDNDESPSKKTRTDTNHNQYHEDFDDIFFDKFGIKFPLDFYQFYEFLQEEGNKSFLSLVDLDFTGPYDLLCGRISKSTTLSKAELLLHGRFYYDMPEIQTVLYAKGKSGFHIGYFRDDPKELPILLASNKSNENGEFSVCGDNIFASVFLYCKNLLKSSHINRENPKEIKAFIETLEKKSKKLNISLDPTPSSVKKYIKNVNSKTFNKIGLTVPMDKTGVGYRELPTTDRELKQILTKIVKADTEEKKNKAFDELDEIITLVQFANDECDYGMGLELGLDLFAFGNDAIRGPILHLLPLAYQLLRRNLYADIIKLHMENRIREGFVNKVQN